MAETYKFVMYTAPYMIIITHKRGTLVSALMLMEATCALHVHMLLTLHHTLLHLLADKQFISSSCLSLHGHIICN